MLHGRLSGERIRDWWENTRSSLWFIPAIMATIAILLSVIIPELDRRAFGEAHSYRRILFYGSPSAARTILTVIAGSLVTVISLTFSITLLTLQQASTQFTPRIMRAFMRHPLNQAVLGAYIATFLYAILVLRQVRDEAATLSSFVPILATTTAILLALVCLGLLVAFLNHSALMLNASTIVENVHADLIASIERLHPALEDTPASRTDEDLDEFRQRHSAGPSVEVRARSAGYLRIVDDDRLAGLLPEGGWAIVHPIPGDYVIRGTLLVEAGAVESLDVAAVRDCFILGAERSLAHDALFGVRQLADVALKGMSPAIFDPTTAEHAISCLGDGLAYLSGRAFPEQVRVFERGDEAAPVVLWVGRPRFADYVREGFSQLRHVAGDDIHVALHLLATLEVVARHAGGAWCVPVLREVEEMIGQLEQSRLSPGDRVRLRQRAERILALAEARSS